MASAIRFFYSQAGFGYDPAIETRNQGRWRGARQLAEAEAWAASQDDLEYVWENDPDCTEDQFEFPEDKAHVREHGGVCCALVRKCPDHGVECRHAETLASLCGITESLDNRQRDNYRRVVEAELALEAMPELAAA